MSPQVCDFILRSLPVADDHQRMVDPDPEKQPPSFDDPIVKARTVRRLLIAAPFLFVSLWLMAALQGASNGIALMISGIALAGCLGTALSIQVLGSQSRHVLTAVMILIALVSFFGGGR
ncbi:MAG: hypothetical protein ACRCVZ_09665 [Aestuariivirga sp.]